MLLLLAFKRTERDDMEKFVLLHISLSLTHSTASPFTPSGHQTTYHVTLPRAHVLLPSLVGPGRYYVYVYLAFEFTLG